MDKVAATARARGGGVTVDGEEGEEGEGEAGAGFRREVVGEGEGGDDIRCIRSQPSIFCQALRTLIGCGRWPDQFQPLLEPCWLQCTLHNARSFGSFVKRILKLGLQVPLL